LQSERWWINAMAAQIQERPDISQEGELMGCWLLIVVSNCCLLFAVCYLLVCCLRFLLLHLVFAVCFYCLLLCDLLLVDVFP